MFVQGQVQQNYAHPTEQEHKPRREPFNDVLPVHSSGEKDHGFYVPRDGILRTPDARWLDDDIVDETGDHQEIGGQDKGEDSHGRGQGKGRHLQAHAGDSESAVRELQDQK